MVEEATTGFGSCSVSGTSIGTTNGNTHFRITSAVFSYNAGGFNWYYNPTLVEFPVWADCSHTGNEAGAFLEPHNTILEAVTAASAGDTIKIKAGNCPETLTINKDVKLEATRATSSSGSDGTVDSGVQIHWVPSRHLQAAAASSPLLSGNWGIG